ncbi:hypothetical protein WG66_012907, partial [Moniliophthora roreri]
MDSQKCDGERPSCGPCRRSTEQFQDCEYTDSGATQSQILQEQIAVLESRLQQLQGQGSSLPPRKPTEDASAIQLHEPYRSGTSLEDTITPQIKQRLLGIFIDHALDIGFFLNIDRFANSALNTLPTERARNALLNTAYLWATHLSTLEELKHYESFFLKRALAGISQGLSGTSSPGTSVSRSTDILSVIQAEYLIAVYYFRNVKILEGKYHMTTAMSLAISAGLHTIRSLESTHLGNSAALGPPADAIEEGERITAFWAILSLNYCWTAIDSSPSNVVPSMRTGLRIDTPWPEDMETYVNMDIQPHLNAGHTVLRFLTDVSGTYDSGAPLSWRTFYAKASILFEQATHIGSKHWNNMVSRSPNTARSSVEFSTLDSLIIRFTQTMSTIHPATYSPLIQKHLSAAHFLAHIACIRLHYSFVDQQARSRQRVIDSAKAATTIITRMDGNSFIGPITGPLWMIVFQTLIEEFKKA